MDDHEILPSIADADQCAKQEPKSLHLDAAAEHQETKLTTLEAKLRWYAIWCTALMGLGLGAKCGCDYHCEPEAQVVGRVDGGMQYDHMHTIEYTTDFESIPDGTILLDAHDATFTPLFFRMSRENPKTKVLEHVDVQLTMSRHGNGPVIRTKVGDVDQAFSIGTDTFGSDNRAILGRASKHVSTIGKDATGIVLRSKTRMLQGSHTLITPEQCFALAQRLSRTDEEKLSFLVDYETTNANGTSDKTFRLLHFEREPIDRPAPQEFLTMK